MNPFIFMTDSDCDIPYDVLDTMDIQMVYMPYMVDGKEYFEDLGRGGGQKEYFDKMREGAAPVTSLMPTAHYLEVFEPILQAGKDILFLSFSSNLSGTYANILTARDELLEKYKERTIIAVDTLSISGPQSILVKMAYERYQAGQSMQEIAAWVEENKMKVHACITVDDLKYLRRGGRISAFAATMGTVLDLKPIVNLTAEGKLASTEKVQGRKRALRTVADQAAARIDDPANAHLTIIHADALSDAERLSKLIQDRVEGLVDIRIEMIGSVIGAHCGPGTVAACFFGVERR